MAAIAAAAITAAAGIGSSLLAADSAGDAQSNSLHAALLNRRSQEERNDLLRREADRSFDLATASRFDANGGSVRFVPGVGFISEVNPTKKAALEAADVEELRRLTEGATQGAAEQRATSNRRLRQGELSDAFLEDALRSPRFTGAELASISENDSIRDTNRAFDETKNDLLRQMQRSGANIGQQGQAVASLARERSAATGGGLGDIGAIILASQLADQERGGNLGIASQLANQASGFPTMSFNPTGIPNLDAFANSANANNAGLLTAATQAPQFNPPGANFADALAAGSIGSSIGGLIEMSDLDIFGANKSNDRQIGNKSSGNKNRGSF